jgi:effector-binding domain-containing protein
VDAISRAVVRRRAGREGLARAHQAIRLWCESNGHRLAGPSREIYGHWQPEWDNNPSRIGTDVFYLVSPAGPPSA